MAGEGRPFSGRSGLSGSPSCLASGDICELQRWTHPRPVPAERAASSPSRCCFRRSQDSPGLQGSERPGPSDCTNSADVDGQGPRHHHARPERLRGADPLPGGAQPPVGGLPGERIGLGRGGPGAHSLQRDRAESLGASCRGAAGARSLGPREPAGLRRPRSLRPRPLRFPPSRWEPVGLLHPRFRPPGPRGAGGRLRFALCGGLRA